MRIIRRIAGLFIVLAIALPASAQFGHPLKGTWSGDWGPSKDKRTHVVLEFTWDGKMENIGAYQRVLSGTWTEGATKSDFKVVRN